MTYTLVHRTALDVSRCETEGLAPLPYAQGLFRLSGSSGSLQSPAIETPAPFDDLVGSWNARVPEGSVLSMQTQARIDGTWSKWFELGASRGGAHRSPGRQEDENAFVDIDTLKLKRKAQAFRYRFLFSSEKDPVILKLAAVAVSDAEAPSPSPFEKGPWVGELKVRPRSQMEEQERYKHDICSPTTLAMALDFGGAREPTVEVAESAKDSATGMFGVWPSNISAAAARGFEAYAARLDSLADLEKEIASGHPVPVSITFAPGELDGSPLKKTKGHFVLVTGFTAKGDVITLDPAAPDRRGARRVYDRAQFHLVWRVHKRGLAYLVAKPLPRRMTVGVPVSNLTAEPRPTKGLSDPNHFSQLLYGEAVTVLSVKGDWARVMAEEQEDFLRENKWQGYPGWMPLAALGCAPAPAPDAIVRTRQTLAQAEKDILTLSVGTRLRRLSQDEILLIDGRRARIEADSVSISSDVRRDIIKTAELFLGTSYYWGGRSGVQSDPSIGVDCSGLANLAYRVQGIDIPRDAHEQKLKSRPVAAKDLAPGDLIFLTDSARSKTVTHVMLYTGGDGLIESRQTPGRALRATFTERFGKALSGIKAGEAVTDVSGLKPRRRLIYFGTYLLK